MRGKYRLHKQLGALLPLNLGGSAVPGTLHMPFPGIYHIIHQGGGGGGSGGNTSSEFTAQGNGGYGGTLVEVKLSFRQSAFRQGGNAGTGGAPGTPGTSGWQSYLSDGQSASYAWGGPGGSGYGGAPPTGNGGAPGASRAYGGNGGWGSLTRYVLVG